MISVNDFKTGMTIQLENNIFKVLDFQHVKPGKGSAFVRTKLKNLRTGSTIDHTFNSGIKVKKANLTTDSYQYSYKDGDEYVFMNMSNYELINVPKEKIVKVKFLKDDLEVKILKYESEILDVVFPEKISMKIIKTDPAVKGDTTNNALKEATTETGLIVKVPLFINEGDMILISTNNSSYVSRI